MEDGFGIALHSAHTPRTPAPASPAVIAVGTVAADEIVTIDNCGFGTVMSFPYTVTTASVTATTNTHFC